MRFLFVSTPDMGHLHPLLSIAARLSSLKQHSVLFASLNAGNVKEKVEGAGVKFLSLCTWGGSEELQHAETTKMVFDAALPMKKKLQAAAICNVQMYGLKMSSGLFAYLEECNSADLPHVIVTDNMAIAGYDAAEKFHIPLAVVVQYPLSQALLMSGLNSYNLPSCVPFESAIGTWQNCILNPIFKRLYALGARAMWDGIRDEERAQLGLPPMAPSSGGMMAVQPGVPRVMHICASSWELNPHRPLPDNWHMVGPTGVDYTAVGSYPPKFGAKDSAVQQLLQQAQDACEPVVYVATGTMVMLQPSQVSAMAAAFKTLAEAHKVRFLWSMKEDTQQLLPAELRSSSSSTGGGISSSRIMVLPWINQAAVLAHPQLKLFISHAGLGSTHEGLAAGVPILALPFAGDQPINAAQLVSNGLGLALNPAKLQAQQLVDAVQKLLNEPAFAEKAAAAGQRIRSESGPQKAVDLLVAFAS